MNTLPPTEGDRNRSWFSAKLRFALLIADVGLQEYEDRVYIFAHSDAEGAFARAVQIGKSHEHQYVSVEGREVRWRLAAVLALDPVYLDPGPLGELETYAERVPAEVGSVPFDGDFRIGEDGPGDAR